MSVFDDFASAYTRFRMAAEYNGHLWHHLADYAKDCGINSTKHRRFLLRELRCRLQASANDERTIAALIDELVGHAYEFLPSKSGGRSPRIVACPWLSDRDNKEHGISEHGKRCRGPTIKNVQRDCRRGFREGMKAHRHLLEIVDAHGIARDQAREYDDWPSHAKPETSDLDGVAWVLLGEDVFLDGCLSPKTLSHLDLAILALLSAHDDPACIQREDIVRIIRKPRTFGKVKRITIYGRFGSIIRDVLVEHYGRRGSKDPHEEVRPTPEVHVLQADTDVIDAWEILGRQLNESHTESQPLLRALVNSLFRKGAERRTAYEQAAQRFGLSLEQVRKTWREFERRLRIRGE